MTAGATRLTVDLLSASDSDAYRSLVLGDPANLLFSSLEYRNFLQSVLDSSEPRYLVARKSGRILGAFPVFVKFNSRHGNVANSLPFFGSHGGLLLAPDVDDRSAVADALIRGFHDICRECRVSASTVVHNPLLTERDYFSPAAKPRFTDERIGQFTPLPQAGFSDRDVSTALMGSFHQKTRNAIRKAQKSGLRIGHDPSIGAMESLAAIHQQNMEAVGGLAKAPSIFNAIRDCFEYDRAYRVYLAEKDGAIVAALLVFFFNRTAEYYTPATRPEFRELQPMSLLIFESMQEAIRRKYTRWNWGGTWLSQTGVYQFKKRWGTVDRPYKYQIEILDPGLLALTPQETMSEFPYFYVAPFKELGKRSGEAR